MKWNEMKWKEHDADADLSRSSSTVIDVQGVREVNSMETSWPNDAKLRLFSY